MKRDDATEAQVRAAQPMQSTWLSANAGSGKTRVLTDRVARLLLAQVPPERILCLTYTKAAASEMQNRLFQRLGEWAMLRDENLRAELVDLGEPASLSTDDLRRARTLFAAAIEAPGGLKIQTIHSFCSSILRRFPLEAGVSPQFTEIEDRAAALLRDEIIEEMAQGDDADLLQELALKTPVFDLTALTGEIVGLRSNYTGGTDEAKIRDFFGLAQDANAANINAHIFAGGEKSLLDDLKPLLATSGKNDVKALDILNQIATLDETALPLLESAFLTKDGKVPARPIPAAAIRKGPFATQIDALDAWMHRIADARAQRLMLQEVDKAVALNAFADAFLKKYDARKQELGWLDFDDLILKTRDLLNDPKVAAWVLYRLDGGIDHILVDEAQDTSPQQWDVIERLSEDFTSGIGARADVPRTIFVVGDKKQSIYSFQGADPREFDRMRDGFEDKLKSTNTPLQNAELQYSFRSASAILDLVDQVFDGQDAAGFAARANHIAFHHDLPGRVDIWPYIEPKKEERGKPQDKGEFIDTTDKLAEDHHTVILARRIASEIARMIGTQGRVPEAIHDKNGPRAVTAGDVLILVQSRNALFEEIIRACKAEGLPIAGADRLKVAAELAVRDVRALLSFLATPEDDYALAVTLKSPFFGWSEKQLYDLAQGRGGFLWPQLRDDAKHNDVTAVLRDLRDQADFLRPYELIERVLTRHNGRAKLIGRLGAEAEDGIDALLSQALAYERSQTPSLTGFLTWMDTDDVTIKRQMSLVRDEIRVMTVHGAKGLEAPIVVMPDTAKRKEPSRGSLLDLNGHLVWNTATAAAPDVVQARKDEIAERGSEERMRLLYVAMTRAEKWLIVAAAGDVEGEPSKSWYGMISAAAERRGALPHQFAFGEGKRIEPVPFGPLASDYQVPATERVTAMLPAHFLQDAPSAQTKDAPLSPSDLGGAKALPNEAGLDEEAAKERGTLIHTLLEHFATAPQDRWDAVARAILPIDVRADELIAEATRVIENRDLQFVFGTDSLAEVALSAPLTELGGRTINGVVDRLVIGDEIWVIDFKTNAAVPETAQSCPEGLLRQMGAYHAALMQVYPSRPIRTALIWTRTAEMMELPGDLTSAALHRAGAALTIDETLPYL